MNPFNSSTGRFVLGGAGWSSQLTADPTSKPVLQTILHALSLGFRAFDTSPYYHPSEILLGEAFSSEEITTKYLRESLLLMTKCGRINSTTFDYSPTAVRASVLRSLQRFQTDYLDVVFAHDVEFVGRSEVIAAVGTLFAMRDEGLIRYVGISGYPPAVLADIAVEIKQTLGRSVDCVQNYCHMNIQNTTLETSLKTLYTNAGVGCVLNASPLCMGLLRKDGVPVGDLGDFHPAPRGLREASAKAAEWVEQVKGENMASVCLRYAIGRFGIVDGKGGGGVTVLGGGSIGEIQANAETIMRVMKGNEVKGKDVRGLGVVDEEAFEVDKALFDGIREILGEWVDYSWESPDEAFLEAQRGKTQA